MLVRFPVTATLPPPSSTSHESKAPPWKFPNCRRGPFASVLIVTPTAGLCPVVFVWTMFANCSV